MGIEDIPFGERHGFRDDIPERHVQALHSTRGPLASQRLFAIDLLMILNYVYIGVIIISVDALIERAGDLSASSVIDVHRHLIHQPHQGAFGDLLDNPAIRKFSGGVHVFFLLGGEYSSIG